ncbi:hypothetical protein ACFWY9_02980 [Amycolatopsis sp. NPDC059027]
MRTKPCDATIRRGRMQKADQFLTAADMIRDLAGDHEDIADA